MKRLVWIGLIFFQSCGTQLEDNFCPGLSNCVSSSEESSFFFSDDFSRSDASLDGTSDWVLYTGGGAGSVEIVSKKVVTEQTTVGIGVAHYSTIIPQSNVRTRMTVNINSAAFSGTGLAVLGLLSRNAVNNNFQDLYFCGIDETLYGNGQLVIYERVGGAPTLLSSSAVSAVPLANGDRYVLDFSLNGTSLTCSISGGAKVSVSATDDTRSDGFVGFGLFNNGAAAQSDVDNFIVELL